MSDNKIHTHSEILAIFQSRISELSAETAIKYRRTLSEFDCFLAAHKLSLVTLTECSISDWAVELMRQGLSRATIVQRLNILSSLFKTPSLSGAIGSSVIPREIVRELESESFILPPLLSAAVFDRCMLLLREFVRNNNPHNMYGDILLFSILNGVKPLDEIIQITKDNLGDYKGISRTILDRNTDGRRKFVFDLRQSYQTPHKIVTAISEKLGTVFNYVTGNGHFTFESLASSLWAALAMRCGATASAVLESLDHSAVYAIPRFSVTQNNRANNPASWQPGIEALLTHELPKWYVMRMRRGVRFEELRKEINDRIRPIPELFYPVEIIKRQLRGKTTAVEQPYISQTVFFKSYPEDILPMFAQIGDKAWCLRLSNNTGSPYAAIPQAEMQRFQSAIGVFTADSELHPLGSLKPKPGEKVILIQAGYSNREAQVEEVMESDCGTVLFRVKLTTDYGYEWRATIDSRQIDRILKNE